MLYYRLNWIVFQYVFETKNTVFIFFPEEQGDDKTKENESKLLTLYNIIIKIQYDIITKHLRISSS